MKNLPVIFLLLLIIFCVDVTPVNLDAFTSTEITVTVEGAVEDEMVSVTVPMYTNVKEVLELVTLSENADITAMNMNQICKDHDVINVPFLNEEVDVKISINQASIEELTTLPGIGPSTAEKIVKYRNENGYFQTLEDIQNVSGIGPAKYEKIQDYITL